MQWLLDLAEITVYKCLENGECYLRGMSVGATFVGAASLIAPV